MKQLYLFLATFGSAFLLFFGLAAGALMVVPVLAQVINPGPEYVPQLPLSADREEEFFSIEKNPGRKLYPEQNTIADIPVTGQNRIIIPSIDVDVPIEMSPSLEDDDIIKTLNFGAAVYPNGVLPGRLGNTFIAAHSTGVAWHGKYRFAFLRINELEPGNLLYLDFNGTRYIYEMTDRDIITPTPDYRIESGRPVPTMSLMACWPLWSTQKRMIINAELTSVTQLTEVAS